MITYRKDIACQILTLTHYQIITLTHYTKKMIFPDSFEEKIGFDKIKKLVSGLCISSLGKDKINTVSFKTYYTDVKLDLELTNEFKEIIEEEANLPIQHFFDIRADLHGLRIEGTSIETEKLFNLKRSLEEINAIIKFFTKAEEDKYPQLRMMASYVPVLPHILAKISDIIDNQGNIKDSASPELREIRSNLRSKMSSASKVMHSILQKAKQNNIVESDTQLSVRDGKMLIPVAASNKRKIKGYVADESSTGKTSFIEPIEIIELNNDIKELEFAEHREILKILLAFSDYIRPNISDLLESYDFLANIDFIRAKALFAIRISALYPKIKPKSGFQIFNARHPLLFLSFEKENKKVEPLDISLYDKQRIILISGPNAGGKSVCLKTVGLLQYMLQCGLLVPVDAKSTMGLFDSIFIDIGDEQSIEDDLSTYSSHLTNMKKILENANEKSLVLIDEFGTGTEPALGGAIAEAMLEQFGKIRMFGLISTHYGNLKHFVDSAHNMVNGAMLFDSKRMSPLYKLEIGRPGSSFAFEIAQKIGLPHKLLKSAEGKVGKQHINFEKHLQEIEQEQRRLSNLNKSLKQKKEHLENALKKHEEETKLTIQKRKQIIEDAKQTADSILSGVNKKIEKSIHEIKKSQAEKDKTKKARHEIEDLKKKTKRRFEEESRFLTKKVKKIQQKKAAPKRESIDNQKNTIHNLSKGDRVKLDYIDNVCEVLEIKGDNILVSMGSMQMHIDKSKVLQILPKLKQQPKAKKQSVNWDASKAKNNFSYGLDVRGKRADEALHTIEKYIDKCIMLEVKEVKILHGKGNGILRQLIQDYLRTVDFVSSVKDEKVEFGGTGITVVNFDYF